MNIIGTINGADKILSQFNAMGDTMAAAKRKGVRLVAIRLRDVMTEFAKAGHPEHPNVITGQLSTKITYDGPDEEGDIVRANVGSPTPYAPYVEYGHSQEVGRFVPALGKRLVAGSVKAYPFARPAALQVFDGGEAEKIFAQSVNMDLGIFG